MRLRGEEGEVRQTDREANKIKSEDFIANCN